MTTGTGRSETSDTVTDGRDEGLCPTSPVRDAASASSGVPGGGDRTGPGPEAADTDSDSAPLTKFLVPTAEPAGPTEKVKAKASKAKVPRSRSNAQKAVVEGAAGAADGKAPRGASGKPRKTRAQSTAAAAAEANPYQTEPDKNQSNVLWALGLGEKRHAVGAGDEADDKQPPQAEATASKRKANKGNVKAKAKAGRSKQARTSEAHPQGSEPSARPKRRRSEAKPKEHAESNETKPDDAGNASAALIKSEIKDEADASGGEHPDSCFGVAAAARGSRANSSSWSSGETLRTGKSLSPLPRSPDHGSDAGSGADAAEAAVARLPLDMEIDHDGLPQVSSNQVRGCLKQPDNVATRASVFQYHYRHVRKLLTHFGPGALLTLGKNLNEVTLISLFSGLGGAEISVALLIEALRHTVSEELAVTPAEEWPEALRSLRSLFPLRPRLYMVCDYNPDCQKVLRSHKEALLCVSICLRQIFIFHVPVDLVVLAVCSSPWGPGSVVA